MFVAEDEITKQIVDFVSGGVAHSNDLEYATELYAIYLLGGYRGRGIGEACTVPS